MAVATWALFIPVIFVVIFVWGGTSMVRNFGGKNVLITCLAILPLLAIGLILLSLVSYRSASYSGFRSSSPEPVVREHKQGALEDHSRTMTRDENGNWKTARQAVESPTDQLEQAVDSYAGQIDEFKKAVDSNAEHIERLAARQHAQSASFSTVDEHSAATHRDKVALKADLILLIIAGMLALALMIGVSVYLSAQGGTLRWSVVGSKLISILWAIPALAVVSLPLTMVAQQLGEGQVISAVAARTTAVSRVQPDVINTSHQESASEDPKTTEIPAWVTAPPMYDGPVKTVVVHSLYSPAVDDADKQRALEKAQENLLASAESEIRGYFAEMYPVQSDYPIPNDLVRQAIGNVYLEEKAVDEGTVFRRHAQVKLTPDMRERLLPEWKSSTSKDRLHLICVGLGVLTLLLGTTAGYLRLDGMTDGKYRGRLKVASLSLITAGALVGAIVLS